MLRQDGVKRRTMQLVGQRAALTLFVATMATEGSTKTSLNFLPAFGNQGRVIYLI
jgi:hypothetical protein